MAPPGRAATRFANKAAAAGYQDLFKKQMAIFEETMGEAQKALKGFEGKLDADTAKLVTQLGLSLGERATQLAADNALPSRPPALANHD